MNDSANVRAGVRACVRVCATSLADKRKISRVTKHYRQFYDPTCQCPHFSRKKKQQKKIKNYFRNHVPKE